MAPRLFSLLIGAGTILAWFSWLLVFFNLNPDEAGWLGVGLFYISLLLSFIGTFFFIGKFLRHKLWSKQLANERISNAIRQAALFGLLLLGWLALNSQRLANLVNLLLLLFIATALELFFISRHKHPRPTITV